MDKEVEKRVSSPSSAWEMERDALATVASLLLQTGPHSSGFHQHFNCFNLVRQVGESSFCLERSELSLVIWTLLTFDYLVENYVWGSYSVRWGGCFRVFDPTAFVARHRCTKQQWNEGESP